MNLNISGLQAAQTMFDVTANNLANVATPGFAPQRANLASTPSGVAVTGISPTGDPETDIATEMVGLVVEKTMYAANARALSTENDMLGALFDERA